MLWSKPLLALALLGVLCSVTSLASASPGPPYTVTLSKTRGGPDVNAAVVNVTKPRSFYIRLSEKLSETQQVTLEDRSVQHPAANYRIKWFQGRKNVTSATHHGGYQFTLKADHAKSFRLFIKPLVATPGAACAFGEFLTGGTDQTAAFLYVNDTGICG